MSLLQCTIFGNSLSLFSMLYLIVQANKLPVQQTAGAAGSTLITSKVLQHCAHQQLTRAHLRWEHQDTQTAPIPQTHGTTIWEDRSTDRPALVTRPLPQPKSLQLTGFPADRSSSSCASKGSEIPHFTFFIWSHYI